MGEVFESDRHPLSPSRTADCEDRQKVRLHQPWALRPDQIDITALISYTTSQVDC
jgi:hypothetical protein